MQTPTHSDPSSYITQMLQQYIVIFGKDITLAKVKYITGMIVSEDGRVLQLSTEPESLIHQVQVQFSELSPFVVTKISEKLDIDLSAPHPEELHKENNLHEELSISNPLSSPDPVVYTAAA